jgi:hypothetical protein
LFVIVGAAESTDAQAAQIQGSIPGVVRKP